MSMKLKILSMTVAAIAFFAASGSAQAAQDYRACLHEQAEIFLLGNYLLGNPWPGNAVLKAASYCAAQQRLQAK
jgi:hypothetical protein